MATGSSTNPTDLLGMSDEDFFNMGVPPTVTEAAAPVEALAPASEAAPVIQVEDDPLVEGEQPPEIEGAGESAPAPKEVNPLDQPDDQLGAAPLKEGAAAPVAPVAGTPAASPAGSEKPAGDPVPGSEAAPAGEAPAAGTETPPDYEALYKKLMAPLKANGKTIDLRNPEELVQLAQMGANYTRKLQELAPHRKILTMLQNNGLLDEGKLSFLIDIEKKNPEAIKKLVKDAGLDPMDIDVSTTPTYVEGNHRVSDAEVNFTAALDELSSNPTGQETLRDIHANWDQASKDALWQQPELLTVIHDQRETGTYAKIVTEMDRQRTLGALRHDLPFLQAYYAVGAQLTEAGKLAPAAAPAQEVPAPASVAAVQPVAVRAAVPKPTLANGDLAAAASPSRGSPRKAQEVVNPLSMSDDDFLKLTPFKNRL